MLSLLYPLGARASLVNCLLNTLEALTQEFRIRRCPNPECIAIKTNLVRLGYDPGVAERIAVYRPDIYKLIRSPEVQITPDKLIMRPDIVDTFSRDKWFASQSQDRNLVTVYRGLKGNGKSYDSTYYHAAPYMELKGAGPISDTRVFTIDDMSKASRYSETETMILKMQIPRFMLYTSKGGPWGLVYFRDMVPNDLLFVSHMAFLKPGVSKDMVPAFIPLEEALPLLPRVHLDPPRNR